MVRESPWFVGCRCTMHGGSWNFYREAEKISCKGEIYSMVNGAARYEQAARIAEIKSILKLAETGDCLWSHEVVEIGRHAGLLELRWQFVQPMEGEADPVLLRLYFIEPSDLQRQLIGLHFSRKRVDGNADLVRKLQNKSIDEANRRRLEGRANTWGV